MVDQVDRIVVQDAASDALNAISVAADKAAASADGVEKTLTRAGAGATTLAQRLDPATKAATAYQRALDDLRIKGAALSDGLATGAITQDQYNGSMGRLQATVAATRDGMAAAVPVAGAMANAHGVAATAATGASVAHAGFTRELVILGHEVVTGNFSRIPGSMMVLAERSGNLNEIFSTMKGLLLGWPGLALAAAAGLGFLAYEAESNERQLLSLQTALRATRDDFTAMGAEARAAAKSVAGTSGFSSSDSIDAAKELASQPAFVGTQGQLESLIHTAGDLAVVMGVTLPVAAKTLATAMQDPGAEADKLAKEHFPGMSQALADAIKLQADAGDKAAAFGQVLGVVRGQVGGAAAAAKTELQTALSDLGKAFHGAGEDGQSFGQAVGDAVGHAATATINAVAAIVGALNTARGQLAAAGGAQGTASVETQQGFFPDWMVNGNSSVAKPTTADVQAAISAAAARTGIDPALLARLQGAEGQLVNGQWQTSATGRVGPMQVAPSLFAGMQAQPGNFPTVQGLSDLSNPTQNVQAGAAFFAHLLAKYGDVQLAVLAYHDGEPAIDKVLAGQGAPSQAALSETRQVLSGYSGNGLTAAAPGLSLPIPPIPPDQTGVVNRPDDIVNAALAKADKAGTALGTGQNAFADIQAYQAALSALTASGDTSSESVVKLQQALAKAQVEFSNALDPLSKLTHQTDIQISAQTQIAASWANGAAAASHATNETKAQAEALTIAAPGTQAYAIAVATLTAKYYALTVAQQNNTAAQQQFDQAQQIQYLQAEAATVGESADIRARDLAVLKERQTIEKTLPDIEAAQKDKLLANAAAIADGTNELQRQQNAMSEIGNMATQVADQIGQAITQAFVNGNGAAVNFGNVARGVLASVLQEVLKLAVINPILNSLIGGTRTTLGDVGGLLGSIGGVTGGVAGGSTGGGLGNIVSLLGLGKNVAGLSGFDLGGSLGLTGPNGIFSGVGSSVSGILSTGTGIGADSAGTALLDSAGIDAGSGLGGATIGSLIGGAGLGFGAGSLVNSLLGGKQTGGTIGSGVGAGAGALIGSVIPGVGTLIGGLLGGLFGGAGGGLIGPPKANPFTQTPVTADANGVTIGHTLSQIDNAGPEVQQLQSEAAAINSFMKAAGLFVGGVTAPRISIGQGTSFDPTKFADLFSDNGSGHNAFSEFRFASANDPTLNTYLGDKSYSQLADLQTAVTAYQTLVGTTIPALKNLSDGAGKVSGSLNDQIAALTAQFGPAITAAQQFGVATGDLVSEQTTAIQKLQDTALGVVDGMAKSVWGRYLTAKAGNDNSPGEALGAQLYNFDVSAATQRQQFSDQIVSIYGDSYKLTQGYADRMAQLEDALGQERLSIVQSYNDKLAQTATTAVASISAYLDKLPSSSLSPLSPQDQYSLARSRFGTDASAAARGDFTALSGLTGDADALLNASRTVNGSGTAYVADFQRVLAALTQAASTSPDTLTASILQAETRTQTQTLAASLADLGVKLDRINSQLTANLGAPARLAA